MTDQCVFMAAIPPVNPSQPSGSQPISDEKHDIQNSPALAALAKKTLVVSHLSAEAAGSPPHVAANPPAEKTDKPDPNLEKLKEQLGGLTRFFNI